MAQQAQDVAVAQQQAEGRRCRLVLRLADALSDQPDPDRLLDRLWTAAGEYGLVSIQWWSPRFEARRVVDAQGPRWERQARPNAMEIDCAQAGSALQYADRQAEVMPGRARWRLCIPVNEDQRIAAGGVLSFTADRRFTLEESDAFEQCAGFMERAMRNVDERIEQVQQVAQRESELKHSLEALVQEVERTRRNEALQTALFQIARLASDQAHAHNFNAKVHSILGGLMRVDTLAILLEDGDATSGAADSPEDDRLELAYLADGLPDNAAPLSAEATEASEALQKHGRLATALAHQATRRRAPVLARDPRRGAAAGSWMAAPLLDEGRAIGALCLRASEGHSHGAEDLDILALCAQQVAHAINRQRAVALLEDRVALRTAELREQQAAAQRQALHDPLTDLPNRRHLEQHLEEALECARTGTPLVLMFLDLDHFKAVNDQFGHAAGDAVLVEASKRLAACLRPCDFVARLSGDEFIVLIQPADDNVGAQRVGDRLIKCVGQPITLEDGKQAQVGCSIGWTRVAEGANVDELTAAGLLARADQAMYTAKRSGRGKAISFEWDRRAPNKTKRASRSKAATPAHTKH
jgi:diguanylate cyclase (GGDEF)-like protein